MKRLVGLLAAVVLLVGVDASAQQRPEPVGGGEQQQQQQIDIPKPNQPLPVLRYPAPAANYERYVQYWLQLLRSMPSSRYHVAQVDVDSAVLMLKDCSARIEADGYVTRNEAKACRKQMMAKLHEIATPYMMQFAAEN